MKTNPKRPRDTNQLAKFIVDALTSEGGAAVADQPAPDTRTPEQIAASMLGRKGGLKGGKARAANMTAAERSEQAKSAARSRWDTKTK